MVERRHEADFRRQQHAIAKHIARHVAHADDGERLSLDVLTHFAEMALDRFPGAARGDAHLLVVIPGRAARGERVAQPMALFKADGVGGVGEGGRALVGGNHEIGVFPIPDDRTRRMHDLAFNDVICHAEQRGDELLVGVAAAFEPGVAIRAVGELFGIEAAFRADRYDDGVLHLLGLDEAEDFGAVVRRAV